MTKDWFDKRKQERQAPDQPHPAEIGEVGEHGGATRHLQIGQMKRDYLLYTPATKPRPGMPLLLVFHGAHQDAKGAAKGTGFNELAEKAGFVVAYPSGVDRHWNDGRGTVNPGVDDVGFARAVIADVQRILPIDSRRIYVAGASNGGLMAQRLACEASDQIAAFASVIASLPTSVSQDCKPNRAVPLLMINGTKDKATPWHGGEMGTKGGQILSVPDTAKFWARHNACQMPAQIQSLPDHDPTDGTRVLRHQYSGCQGGSEVVLLEVDGGGHTWPGGGNQIKLILGVTSNDISATEVIWSFFQRFAF